MQVIIFNNADAVGEYAADLIAEGAESGAVKVLGVATGSSPLPVYEALSKRRSPDVAALTVFALDEYVGLSYSHPESYHAVIDREVTKPLALRPAAVHVPDGASTDLTAACEKYEAEIVAAGGIDLQLLGIGATGHIGFNEPTSSFASRTRIKTLTKETRADNSRFFNGIEEVPKHCITQGLGTIMDAGKVLLIAHGVSKAAAIARAVEGPLTSMCPASILQMHPDATVLVDEEAASELSLSDYYRFVFANRPSWQR